MVLLVALTALPAVPAHAVGSGLRDVAASPAAVYWPGSGVIDYAAGFNSSTPGRLARGGVGIAIRYVGSSAWKCLTRKEANALRDAGIDIVAVYETSAGWMLGGRKAGVAAAKKARAAVVACGGPRDALIYFACDVGTHNYMAVNECLRGAASVLGAERVGIYGSYYVCDSALKSGYATKAWQTIAWSNGKVLPKAALFQTNKRVDGTLGLSYDSNFARADDIGQWEYAGPASVSWAARQGVTNATLNAIDFAGGADGWAVGDSGTVLRTADGGVSWAAQPTLVATALRAVDFASATDGWAVGDAGTVIHTANGGGTWTAQTVPTIAALRAVRCTDAASAWAVGDAGTMLRSAGPGGAWTLQPVPTTATLTAIDFANGKLGCVVGSGGTMLRTADGGATWTTQSVPTSAALRAVHLVDSQLGWAVGDAGTILRTTDGGAKWTLQAVPTTATLRSVHFLDAAAGWAVGDGGTILRTTNAGAKWIAERTPGSANLSAVRFTGSSTGWAVGESGTMLRATRAGLGRFGTVAGVVTNALTGAPVSGVSVSVGGRLTAPSAVDGSFVAARVPPGTYSVTFSDARYIKRSTAGVDLTAGLRATVYGRLTPRARTAVSKPSVESTMPEPAGPVTIAATLSPASAATAAVTTLYGSHYEQKTVKKRVKGKTKQVKVWYWRSRFVLAMSADMSGGLVAQTQLAGGRWRVQARYPGSGKHLPSNSAWREFAVVASEPTTAVP